MNTNGARKRITAPEIVAKKARGEKIVAVTAYDFPTAYYADRAGVDLILVGDSLGMVVLGQKNTLGVTVDDIVRHCSAAARAEPSALLVADMPFLTAHSSTSKGVHTAGRLIQEAGAGAVKIEGVGPAIELTRRLTAAGVPVVGHLGLTPQSVLGLGGWKIQARKPDQARRLLEDARALQEAGVFALVLETIPDEVARVVTTELEIPTIGIGAGPHCDGQVQVLHDLIGLAPGFHPRHARRYVDLGAALEKALQEYAHDVRTGRFPEEPETVHQPELQDAATWT